MATPPARLAEIKFRAAAVVPPMVVLVAPSRKTPVPVTFELPTTPFDTGFLPVRSVPM